MPNDNQISMHHTKKNLLSSRSPWMMAILLACISHSCNLDQSTISEGVDTPEITQLADVPEWSKKVIWYQIFVERFRNGDPSNDPTKEDIVGGYPGFIPESWAITPWTQDWYKEDAYFSELEGIKGPSGEDITKFEQKIQLRRYGGDLQGVLDQLDYLEDLGITAVYFNPLNDAPSLHKYDPRHWRHIDRNFGPDPKGDAAIIDAETPDDPSTWKMTAADQMFVKIIDEMHQRGIKVILDYSWNHTGGECWAIKDVAQKGANSKFADWYIIENFDDPNTPENEFAYKGWAGIKSLPEIKETVDHHATKVEAYEGNFASEAVKQHIFAISKRWLDPNGDGDPSDGVDGYRLDVAGEVPLGFWRDYRKMVRSVNPETYLLGEIWWEEWPDKLLDPEPFLKGDVFDAVMNYRWYRAARHFFAQAPNKIPVSEFVDSLQSFSSNLRSQNNYAMMNLAASHDVPRVATSLFNRGKYKYQVKPEENPAYQISKPDVASRNTLKLLFAQMFTYIGAPHIWNGDEMGMWGADDPDCRKPLMWPDLEFEDESRHPLDLDRPSNQVKFDSSLFNYLKQLIQIRKAHPVLATGAINYILIADDMDLLAYSRYEGEEEVITIFNTGDSPKTAGIKTKEKGGYKDILNQIPVEEKGNQIISIELPARSVAILSN